MAKAYYCPFCGGREHLKEKLENGTGKNGGKHRRQRMECEDCHYQELIHAEGSRDIKPYERENDEAKERLGDEKLNKLNEKHNLDY